MLFERRAYALRPGVVPAYWDLQVKWNSPHQIPDYLSRNLGYFHTFSGPSEEIVHLYRYDSYEDWRKRLFGLYTEDRTEYFTIARGMLAAQDTSFLSLAPPPELNPIWGNGKDWLPGTPFFRGVDALDSVIVTEETIDVVPGGLPTFWKLYKEQGLVSRNAAKGLIGCFNTLVGHLHRIHIYRWFPDFERASSYQSARNQDASWKRFELAYQPLCTGRHIAYMRLAPLPWMKPLFC